MRNLIIGIGAVASLALGACGGDDSPAAGGGGSVITLSAATPAANNTTFDTSTAATQGNDARAADGFSSTPYCDVYAEGATGANGTLYALQVYFRQSDKQALHVSVVGGPANAPPTYVVFDNNSGNPITGVTVDAAARTVTFNNKVLAGSAGEAGTLSGTFSFPANATGTAGCGV